MPMSDQPRPYFDKAAAQRQLIHVLFKQLKLSNLPGRMVFGSCVFNLPSDDTMIMLFGPRAIIQPSESSMIILDDRRYQRKNTSRGEQDAQSNPHG
jgi:hypothetical protein